MSRARDRTGNPAGHVVKIYDDDQDLAQGVGDFVAEGIAAGDFVLVVRIPTHRQAFESALQAVGVDVPRAAAEGRYVVADAHEVLSSFMVDGVVDSDRFNDAMGDLLRPAGERHIRIFGEMVSVLWDEGNITAAIALESCWNDLATHYDFSLYCAYAMSSFECAPDLAALRDVCDLHSGIMAPDSYADVPSAASSTSADETISEFFLPVPLAIRAVRQFVRSTLVDWGATELLEDAAIVASELATNAVRHARSPFRVSMSRAGSTFKLMVHDGSDDSAQAQPFTADAEGGRGLTLVAALCPAWGTDYVADGKIVWAELAAH